MTRSNESQDSEQLELGGKEGQIFLDVGFTAAGCSISFCRWKTITGRPSGLRQLGAITRSRTRGSSPHPFPTSERMRMKDLPRGEGPREKMDAMGVAALTDAELLALFFRTGGSGVNAVEMGRRLIAKHGSLNALSRCSVEEYQQEFGIGPVKAKELAAVFEMGARVAREKFRTLPVDSPQAIYELVAPGLRSQHREILQVVLLNTRHGLIKIEDISIGTINESLAHPREILRPAITHSAYAMGTCSQSSLG